jgi:hypothetical protein
VPVLISLQENTTVQGYVCDESLIIK